MLLRIETGPGHRPIDLRSAGLWPLGAEILLQNNREESMPRGEAGSSDGEADDSGSVHPSMALSSQVGFAKAKAYFERLALQFPSHRWLPDSISSIQIYLAMFGLWVSFVQDRHRAALNALQTAEHYFSDGDETDARGSDSENPGTAEALLTLLGSTYGVAAEILAVLNVLLASLPYADEPDYWDLKGKIELWMGDLSGAEAEASTKLNGNSKDGGSHPSSPSEHGRHSGYLEAASGNRPSTGQRHRESAQSAFERARRLRSSQGD
jgi:hypothetical protein